MLHDMIHPQEQQLPSDDISSPNSGPLFYFSDTDLFSDFGLQSSEVTPSPGNCCFDESTNYGDKVIMSPSGASTATATSTSTTVMTPAADNDTNINNNDDNNNNNLSLIFDSSDDIDNGISASIDFSHCQPPSNFSVPPPFFSQQDHQFNTPLVQPQIQMYVDNISPVDWFSQYGGDQHHLFAVPTLMGPSPPLPASIFDDDCLSSMTSYVPLNPSSPSCSFLGGPSMAAFMPMNVALPADSSEIFTAGNILTAPHELLPQDLEFQGDNAGIFCPDSMQWMFKPGDLQGLSCEKQQLVGARMSSTPLASEMSSLEDSTFNKVGKLSAEQRKEKIHRYMKKRNERNFTKKIKYACRKTLADSRPRVRGRFAKNDDFGETRRQASSNHEEDDDDDQVVVKEKEDKLNCSDIFTNINGVNSFRYNYSVQSWI
ncbi:MOS4-associated complex 3A [Hibiscus syriacus]|uniref:MOS4-associated complex 3A n=1 Tax=Hibiscus syriacus TaxID=106335 RepID=A0A6A3BBA3_HIBSY|nr:uncharacterized protein LOC120115053 [Hibiscus syriacus]KAE8712402.1 MOS4-associated complex 3A [Hibiscus syriacus]